MDALLNFAAYRQKLESKVQAYDYVKIILGELISQYYKRRERGRDFYVKAKKDDQPALAEHIKKGLLLEHELVEAASSIRNSIKDFNEKVDSLKLSDNMAYYEVKLELLLDEAILPQEIQVIKWLSPTLSDGLDTYLSTERIAAISKWLATTKKSRGVLHSKYSYVDFLTRPIEMYDLWRLGLNDGGLPALGKKTQIVDAFIKARNNQDNALNIKRLALLRRIIDIKIKDEDPQAVSLSIEELQEQAALAYYLNADIEDLTINLVSTIDRTNTTLEYLAELINAHCEVSAIAAVNKAFFKLFSIYSKKQEDLLKFIDIMLAPSGQHPDINEIPAKMPSNLPCVAL